MHRQSEHKESIKRFLCWGFLIILIIPVTPFAQDVNLDLLHFNTHLVLQKDSAITVSSGRKIKSPIQAVGSVGLGLGQHNNLTEANSWTGPNANTSQVYWTGYLELGIGYKRLSTTIHGSVIEPFLRTRHIFDWDHWASFTSVALLLRMNLLSSKSKVNFTPLVGHKWIQEFAGISDPERAKPDSLHLKFADRNLLYGLHLQYTIPRKKKDLGYGLVLGYLHERFLNHSQKADRYRIEWRFLYFETDKENRILFDYFGYYSYSLEFVRWPDGRNEWFFIVSLGVGK